LFSFFLSFGNLAAKDTMDEWDQKKLESVVGQKHKDNKTDIVCKFFLAAIETKKYGWFWECPNGGDVCPYRHALPPGFVLKSKEKAPEDDGPKVSVEDDIEDAVTFYSINTTDPRAMHNLTISQSLFSETETSWRRNTSYTRAVLEVEGREKSKSR